MAENIDTEKQLDLLFPMNQFGRSVRWTAQGDSDGLEATLESVVKDELYGHRPRAGLFYFERLPDGGYEIKAYTSSE